MYSTKTCFRLLFTLLNMVHSLISSRNNYFFGGIGVWTQGFTLAKQACYHLSHTASPSALVILEVGASQVARITGMSHWHPATPTSSNQYLKTRELETEIGTCVIDYIHQNEKWWCGWAHNGLYVWHKREEIHGHESQKERPTSAKGEAVVPPVIPALGRPGRRINYIARPWLKTPPT
jgi:hypothetical protein